MSFPYEYCKWMVEGLKYVDSVQKNNVRIDLKFEGEDKYYNIYHYSTLIAVFNKKEDNIELYDGYSASDRNIINSFAILLKMSQRAYINKGEMYLSDKRI